MLQNNISLLCKSIWLGGWVTSKTLIKVASVRHLSRQLDLPKVLERLSAKGPMAYISVSRGRLRCALQSKLPLVSLDNLGGLHFNFVGKNIERKKHATSRECLQFTMHRKVVTVICFIICDDLFQIEFCRERIHAMFKLEV